MLLTCLVGIAMKKLLVSRLRFEKKPSPHLGVCGRGYSTQMCTRSGGYESVRAASRCSRAAPDYPSTHTTASWRGLYQKMTPAMPSSGRQRRPKSLTWAAAVRGLNSPRGLVGPLSTWRMRAGNQSMQLYQDLLRTSPDPPA